MNDAPHAGAVDCTALGDEAREHLGSCRGEQGVGKDLALASTTVIHADRLLELFVETRRFGPIENLHLAPPSTVRVRATTT